MRLPALRQASVGAWLTTLASAAAVASPSPLQHFTLENGLTVYLRQDHRAPLAVSQLWYHVGSSHEYPGQSGLSHALEHLMFEGSSKIAPGQYSKIFARLGATENAFTTDDATVFHQSLPADRLEVALEAMADAMRSARLGEPEFNREIAVVMAERRSRHDDDPAALAKERTHTLAYTQSSYRTPTIGHRHDLERMTLADLRNWYNAWYHPNNATLVIVGDTTVERLKPMVERHFAGLARAQLPAIRLPREVDAIGERRLTVKLPGLSAGLRMTFNTPSLATAEQPAHAHALRLMPYLLTEGISSRLFSKLVREEEVLLAINSDYLAYQRGDSLLSLHAYPNEGRQVSLRDAENAITAMLEALRQSPPSAAELQRAKARLQAQQVFLRDALSSQAYAIGRHAVSGLAPQGLDDDLQNLQGVSAEQIQQAARLYLTPERLTVTYMQEKDSTHE